MSAIHGGMISEFVLVLIVVARGSYHFWRSDRTWREDKAGFVHMINGPKAATTNSQGSISILDISWADDVQLGRASEDSVDHLHAFYSIMDTKQRSKEAA